MPFALELEELAEKTEALNKQIYILQSLRVFFAKEIGFLNEEFKAEETSEILDLLVIEARIDYNNDQLSETEAQIEELKELFELNIFKLRNY